jgi:CTP synthase
MDKAAGSKQIKLSESKVADSYAKDVIEERFRGRFSFDTDSPLNQEEWLLFGEQAVAEYKEHPWYVCVQFRPEYKSALTKPNPIFIGFIKQAEERNRG